MTDKEPTKEQIKKFWERCGFKYQDQYPDGPQKSLLKFDIKSHPNIDLNNLFQWAVPKIARHELFNRIGINICYQEDTGWWVKLDLHPFVGGNYIEGKTHCSELALALFWATWEILEEQK